MRTDRPAARTLFLGCFLGQAGRRTPLGCPPTRGTNFRNIFIFTFRVQFETGVKTTREARTLCLPTGRYTK